MSSDTHWIRAAKARHKGNVTIDTDQLLRQREKKAIVTLLAARAVLVVALALPDVFISYRFDVALAALTAGTVWIVFNGYLYRLLRHGVPAFRIGVAGLGLDVAMMVGFDVVILLSFVPAEIPIILMTHAGAPLFLASLIVLHGFSLRPVYPLVMTLAGLADLVFGFLVFRHHDDVGVIDALDPGLLRQIEIGLFMMTGAIGAGVTYTAHSARRLLRDEARSAAANTLLRRYFSPQVVQGLADDSTRSPLVEPGGRVLETAVMFCDIRGFTRMTEDMPPQDVLAFLRGYHAAMVDTIFDHGGTIDKFIGDAIMVTFGTPHPGPDDAANAVRAGISMMTALGRLNRNRASKGAPPIAHDIAIHFGPVVAGSIGTETRREYTVLGDVVNTTARMEGLCKSLDEPFLISGAVRAHLSEPIALRPLPSVQVRGRHQELTLFAVDWAAPDDDTGAAVDQASSSKSSI